MKITQDILLAADILRKGGLVAFPTETVYGLGANANELAAINNIFIVKERPKDHPLIVHIAGPAQIADWARDVSSEAMELAQAFWPGPLTLILKKQSYVLDVLSGGQDTIGLRAPNHPVAQALLHEFAGGIAAPSANKFTRLSPTTADAVCEELGQQIELILEGGTCEIGLESTILDLSGIAPVLLRPGFIDVSALEKVIGKKIIRAKQEKITTRAPGMHHLHYAPKTKTRLVKTAELVAFLQSIASSELPVACVHYTDLNLPLRQSIEFIRMPKDAKPYAHELYRILRLLDHGKFKQIIVENVPDDPEWEAIRDRLSKATNR